MWSGSSIWVLLVVAVISAVEKSGFSAEAIDTAWKAAQEADRIGRLPGQPKVNFDMYAGYVTVNKEHGRAHYYYFVEAEEEPENKPLVIWFNGGPGCSSIASGFAEELGPFFINPGGKTLRLNPNAGNKLANVVFVESPAGVGFSYTNTSSDLVTSGDNRTAHDNYAFVLNWLERFPQYKGRPFYLTGESYAGHYVPELSKLIYDNNKKLPDEEKINFKGFMVGNPVIDNNHDSWGILDFLYSHAMISDDLYYRIKEGCDFSITNLTLLEPCILLLYNDTFNEYGRIDPYSVYTPACLQNLTFGGNSTVPARKERTLFNPVLGPFRREDYDPCVANYSLIYFNRPDVQKAMHANTTGIPYPWVGCSETLLFNWKEAPLTVLPIYQELLATGLRLWVFSGDVDSVVPTASSRYSLGSLKLPVAVPWFSWYNKEQVGGREIVYEGNLTLVTVRGAGHKVPILRPVEFLQVFASFLEGSLLPRNPYKPFVDVWSLTLTREEAASVAPPPARAIIKLRLPLGCCTLEPEQLQDPGEFGCRIAGVLRLMTFMDEEKMGCINQFYYLPMVPHPLDSLPHARDTESKSTFKVPTVQTDAVEELALVRNMLALQTA